MSNSANAIATVKELAGKNGNGWKKFKVRLGGFANLPSEKDEEVLSPEFTSLGHKWRLQLYPGGNNKSDDGMVAIYLENLSDKSITIHFGCSIKDLNEKEVHTTHNGSPDVFEAKDNWGWINFCKRSDVIDALVDGTLVLEIRLKVALPLATVTEATKKNGKGFEVSFTKFKNLPTEKGEQVVSSEFTCFGHQWCLSLYPGGRSDSIDGMVAIFLHHISNEPINIKVSLSVNAVIKRKCEDRYEFVGEVGKGWPNFCKRSDLVDALVDGTLVVEVRLKVANGNYQIMANSDAWLLLMKKIGFTYYRDMYCLPGKENRPTKGSSAVEGMDYFLSLEGLRKHLCAYGLPKVKKHIEEDVADAIDQWVRYANVVGLGDAPQINLSDVGKPITWREAWGMLKKLGLSYVRGAYRHPHSDQSKPDLRINKKEDFIIHLARFGIPHVNGIQTDKVLNKEDHLKLDLFIANKNVVDSL